MWSSCAKPPVLFGDKPLFLQKKMSERLSFREKMSKTVFSAENKKENILCIYKISNFDTNLLDLERLFHYSFICCYYLFFLQEFLPYGI